MSRSSTGQPVRVVRFLDLVVDLVRVASHRREGWYDMMGLANGGRSAEVAGLTLIG